MNRSKVKATVVTIIICLLIGIICERQYKVIQLENKLELLGYKEIELESCPMCGDKVTLNQVNGWFYIKCDMFGCGLTSDYYSSASHLAEKWNGIK